jgi:hypothetical protein
MGSMGAKGTIQKSQGGARFSRGARGIRGARRRDRIIGVP